MREGGSGDMPEPYYKALWLSHSPAQKALPFRFACENRPALSKFIAGYLPPGILTLILWTLV